MDSGARVADYLVRAVSRLGIRHLFGVDGANIEDLYDAVFDHNASIGPDAADDRAPLTAVVAKHEFSAATMADGYARSTAGLGVVVATSGGGAVNLVAGLAESFASRVPVLALVGQPPTVLEGKGAFQDSSGRAGAFDAVRLFSPLTRYCARVESPADLPAQLHDAVAAARSGGPAVLLLPKDIQQAELSTPPEFHPPARAHHRDRAGLERVRRALRAARITGKVVIIAGDQIARDDARDELARLARLLDASVGVAPDAKDVYDHHEPGYCGVAGSMGHPELLDALHRAELCLLVGTRMPITARAGLEDALSAVTLAGIGAEPPFLPSLHAHTTDLAATLADLCTDPTRPSGDLAPAVRNSGRVTSEDAFTTTPLGSGPELPTPTGVQSRVNVLTPLDVPPADGPGLRYRAIVETVNDALPDGTDVFADAGNTGASVVHHLRMPRGGRFTVALGMGGMGYAFGAGIGSAFARCRRADGGVRHTVVIAGDGAFFMHGMEIHTAVEHRLPITFVVLNNNAHAMCITREQLFYGDRYSYNRFRPADIGAGVAAMFSGLRTHRPTTLAELAATLRRCVETPGPSFVAVDCDPDEIPPFTPFLTASRRLP
ncbi:thiamine pyrophosphate-binding protein [Nocardia otitidiscaviarum]|uniref:thiamine pyrophosphate-binding protein n=1 Tax=Nocardia otitidiscaviarum TaxID=1823 RepID=UPI0004A6B412|nr:thiamine pyrophosphate-binding protein [Nocardia otitidiscaviarum]MBF6137125.1 thiamine pyrophosphate-binding protein [Nocardia otitidiscaviarum]MBF6488024.1 thiamine pyrophosphate-binding protein [Nocardia otitidiscaviarum]